MINSNSTVDFNFGRADAAESLSHQLVTSNNPESMHAAMAHQKNSLFLSICSNEPNQKQKGSGIIISETFAPNTKDKKSFEIMVNTKERVKVQHLETPSKLQNNRWNYHSFCNIRDSGKEKMPNINNNNITINQNESAFRNIRSNGEELEKVAAQVGNSNLEYLNNVLDPQQYANNCKETDKRTSPTCRTKDQENAFRRIEDVHNYSKLNRYSYSNGSSNSSVHEDDDVEDEEECDDDDDEEVDDEVIDETFETYRFLDKKPQAASNIKSNDQCCSNYSNNRNLRTRDRTQLQADQSNAMQSGETDDVSNMPIRPDHHARRPMNAFLIFCKRHRAIVKDRYKSFENRAITKILGDWWASLDANEKKCYTSLAQQNKDAFFNANPNFKWYKLPAPPLRTLHTRPSNTDRLMDQEDPVLDSSIPHHIRQPEDHIFKLADEAQMGDLSTLMCDKKLKSQNALQQALGETTQYLSIQIPDLESPTNKWAGLDVGFKRRLQHDNSLSSNSSEEDLLPKKASRSCKGKIYQELVNSGQIAAITKKPKLPKVGSQQSSEQNTHFAADDAVIASATVNASFPAECSDWRQDSTAQNSYSDILTKCADKSKSPDCSNSQTYELIQFDLEEKIKELPALNLDTYLQRKRNTKKKKKINSKKRNPSSSSKSTCADLTASAITPSPPISPAKDNSLNNQAVGSRKRKARKESITRRDISTIENEVASLLPLQEDFSAFRCNDRYYYTDVQTPPPATMATASLSSLSPAYSNACAIEASPTVDQFSNFLTNINQNISSTSDLLILAEVAAKRTEISN